MNMITCEERTGYAAKEVKFARVAWLEDPGDSEPELWKMYVVENTRSPHSLAVADLDGDGEPEIVAGEHGPRHLYRGPPDFTSTTELTNKDVHGHAAH